MMNSSRCKMCGRLILAGTLCFHAAAHPFDHPHNHTPSPSESVLVLGKIGVSSATTQQVPSMLSSALSTSFKTVTIREHPTAQNALRLSVSTGAGIAVPAGGRFECFVEARYHQVIDAPSTPAWPAP